MAHLTDDTPWPVGAVVEPVGFVYDDTSTDTVDEGDVGYARMSANREVLVKISALAASTLKLAANSGVDIGDVDVASIAAGEAHLGSVGGHTTVVTVTPTLTTHATYASGDFVGTDATPMTFSVARVNAGTGTIISAVLVDYALQSVAGELWLFDTTVTPPADSAAWTMSDADSLKCIGVIPFSTYYATALNSISMGSVGLGIPFVCGAGVKTIFGCFITRGAPTYASGDVSFRLGILQD